MTGEQALTFVLLLMAVLLVGVVVGCGCALTGDAAGCAA